MALYKPGNKVWAHCDNNIASLVGTFPGVVVGEIKPTWHMRIAFPTAVWYEITIEDRPCPVGTPLWYAPEGSLTPRHEGYEGDLVGNWATCPYRPARTLETA
jgi:hypothetical protein